MQALYRDVDAIVQAASDRLRCGVIAFAGETIVLRDPRDEGPSERVVQDLLPQRERQDRSGGAPTAAASAGKALARRGHGRWLTATTLDELARNLQAIPP